MKHLIKTYYPSLSTIVIALFAVFTGGYVYNNVPRYTDFEVILVTICTFMLIKGTLKFMSLWLNGFK